MNDKMSFEDYDIEFIDEDFKGVDKETLKKCQVILKKILNKY